jgi:hypothetical protein
VASVLESVQPTARQSNILPKDSATSSPRPPHPPNSTIAAAAAIRVNFIFAPATCPTIVRGIKAEAGAVRTIGNPHGAEVQSVPSSPRKREAGWRRHYRSTSFMLVS